jgi:hypothetical protein
VISGLIDSAYSLTFYPIGKYTAILAILVVGSFIVPMAQYFWYVRDDDSTDKFFGAKDIPEPPPKKKGWF